MIEPELSCPHPFVGRSGTGVRIAIIDSGVHLGHPHIDSDRIGAGVTVLADGSIVTDANTTLDQLGHGTAVTAAIQEKAGGATCFPVRVFCSALKTSAVALVSAIRWAIDQQVDLVNLSLGSSNTAHMEIFERIVEDARNAGVVLVAAREANGVPCYPGALPEVIGVGLDWDCPREGYRVVGGVDGPFFSASGFPRPIPNVPQRRNLHGISFAVAQMTGFAALALESLDGAVAHERSERVRRALLTQRA